MENTKTLCEQLGIDINISRVSLCFDENGVNNNLSQKKKEIYQKLDELKKKGAEKPAKNFITPVKQPGVKLEDWNNNPVKVEYKKLKTEYDEKLKKYDQYVSAEYTRSNLAYKLKKKLENLVELMTKNLETPTTPRTKKIGEIFEELKGGISKPVFGENTVKDGRNIKPIVGRELKLKFTDLCELTQNLDQLKTKLAEISMEYKETNKLFEDKQEIQNNSLKFPYSVKAAITYILQEAYYNIIELACKNAKKLGKKTVNIENLRYEVISDSPYLPMFNSLPCMKVLQNYVLRKEEYNTEKNKHDSEMKSKKKTSMFKSFEDCEKSGGFMKEVNGQKKWTGLFESDINFQVYIMRMFANTKYKLKNKKLKISLQTKELLSTMMFQFLSQLSQKFQIHRKRRSKILSMEKGVEYNIDEKTLKFEDVIEIFEIILCDDRANKTLENAALFRKRIKELKK